MDYSRIPFRIAVAEDLIIAVKADSVSQASAALKHVDVF
ncbi:MAG: hypothetical protein CM1200mP6_03450 [Anaerolineaceae bacterium]|nr:MAG: hypothetical protein CM1200mP6_03450 [Anaerolineaceae bacterium]